MPRTAHPRRVRWTAVGAALVLVVAVWTLWSVHPSIASAQDEPEATVAAFVATSPEDAIRALVEANGAQYAGDCAGTVSPRDVGKICSKLIEERGNRRAYLIGRTFSEFTSWLFLQQSGGSWQFVGSAPLDFNSTSIDIPWP